jgi:hypothetical protein
VRKRLGDRREHREAERLPQFHGALVGLDHRIELHRSVALAASPFEGVLAERAAGAAAAALVDGFATVTPHDYSVALHNGC